MTLRRPSWVAVLGLALAIGPAAAQRPVRSEWVLTGSRGGYCVWYLADPAIAATMVPEGSVLTPAKDAQDLHPALLQIIRDEPRFGAWIPGAFCLGFYDDVTVDGRVVAHARPDRPIAFGTSSLDGSVPGTTDRQLLLTLFTDTKAIDRAAGQAGLDAAMAKVVLKGRGESDPTVSITVDNVLVSWSGHPSGMPSVGTTRSLSFGYVGSHDSRWHAELLAAPDSSQGLVGALEVDGRKSLAKALKSSPIRAIGRAEYGGHATLTFQRVTPP
ncbi:MAG TPA: hypothetical protein VGM77_00105 [Gemmatimonadales bacterium]|jgi:hypothetical protein